MKLTDMTFHEQYGEVSHEQLRAYRKHNVSPSDHDTLVYWYGDDHGTITRLVKDTRNQTDGGSFSAFLFREHLDATY